MFESILTAAFKLYRKQSLVKCSKEVFTAYNFQVLFLPARKPQHPEKQVAFKLLKLKTPQSIGISCKLQHKLPIKVSMLISNHTYSASRPQPSPVSLQVANINIPSQFKTMLQLNKF